MPCLSLAYWIYALLLAGLAVCWADVLVRPGGLLAPVQARLRAWYRKPFQQWVYIENPLFLGFKRPGAIISQEIDNQWWWSPLWGCYKCVAGQWGFWGYLWLFRAAPYSLLSHLGFAATTITLSIILSKWSQEI